MIDSFHGKWSFLSNFYPAVVKGVGGYEFPSVEHAYQHAKSVNLEEDYEKIRRMTAGQAKRYGRKIEIRPDWESVKYTFMKEFVLQKFNSPTLADWLIETYPHELVEGNTWGDTYWGVCNGKGENHLGKILMEVRFFKIFTWERMHSSTGQSD